MSKNILIIAVVAALYFLFTTCQFDVFTWKDSNNLERIVITPKNPQQQSGVPVVPGGLESDARLEHTKGPVGLGTYGVRSAIKMIPSEKKPQGGETADRVRYPRTHTVSKETSLQAPEMAVESGTRPAKPQVGSAAPDPIRSAYRKPKPVEDYSGIPSPRIFESSDEILLGSFNIDPWDRDDMLEPKLLDDLLVVLAQFDVVAVQGIYTNQIAFLEDLCDKLSRKAGRRFQFSAAVAYLQPTPNDPVPIFLYDTTTMEVDPRSICYIGRSSGTGNQRPSIAFPPLITKFRTRKTSQERAFTFIAVNLNLSPTYEAFELEYLPDIIQTARKVCAVDGKNEDDIVFFGHVGIDPDKIHIKSMSDNNPLTWAVTDLPTNTWGKYRLISENIFFLSNATTEYTGAGGVWNLRRQYRRNKGIPFDQHPVWAKFSIYEGGH
ncbi:MAG: hypothetical protein Q4D98_14245 [Planctomycetia bacterium]|nr:hypothetical protein [Planctomycetia bacterium]